MSRPTSRRAALGAFAAAAMAPAGIGLGNSKKAAASPDAALLAIAPALLPLLERAEVIRGEIRLLYKEADAARYNLYQQGDFDGGHRVFNEVGQRNGYLKKWDIHSDIMGRAQTLIAPFIKISPATLEGLMLKARYAAAMENEAIIQDDISALMKQRWGVVLEW